MRSPTLCCSPVNSLLSSLEHILMTIGAVIVLNALAHNYVPLLLSPAIVVLLALFVFMYMNVAKTRIILVVQLYHV